ncbi:hypothetical protein [Variovorax sp. UC74_104]|uniref:hypothetical protein n=1 Tax=Variovorax sp. UC74_104 TaxID=3374555 RepID=UPI003757E9C7
MEDWIVLNDWNPSEQTLRKWAYDERIQLSDQDADLVLHEEEYLPLLLELADEPSCPRSSEILGTLDYYLMFLVLRGVEEHIRIVEKAVALARSAKTAPVIEWRQLQERRLRYRAGAGPLSREQAVAAARDLLIGIDRIAELKVVDENPKTWEIELSVPPSHRYRDRLSFDRATGVFRFSR